MSALLALYHRDGAPVPPALAERLFAALDPRGPDGRDLRLAGDLALGHQHRWTTPEEVDERQPLRDDEAGVDLAFDGRLDNRDELLAALGDGAFGEAHSRPPSDAALVLAAFRRWGEGCFARLLGPFAAVIADRKRHRLLCARDAVGARTLLYHLRRGFLLAASEEAALLAHPDVADDLDEGSVDRFFALRAPRVGRTFYAAVAELPPGHLLEVSAGEHRLVRFRAVGAEPGPHPRDAREAAERFRALLADAVACRLRATKPPAVLMSGGLDSTTVAALAARSADRDGRGEPVRAVSWLFDELGACDERRYIDAVVVRSDLRPVRFAADGLWPLRGGAARWPRSAGGPLANPYRSLLDRAYGEAAAAGAGVVLTGWFGDDLFAGYGERWRALLHRLPGANLARRLRDRRHPAWLTAAVRARLAAEPAADGPPAERRRAALLDGLPIWTLRGEAACAARAGVDLRLPYRDRRLIEFVLALPARLLHRPGSYKALLRAAAAGLLPEEVRLRPDRSSLAPLFARGVDEREVDEVRRLLYDAGASWPQRVRQAWVSTALGRRSRSCLDGVEAAVPWQCLAWEIWQAGRARRDAGGHTIEDAA
jgi:asparagine synthase (glutamine-hydrolysing)